MASDSLLRIDIAVLIPMSKVYNIIEIENVN